MGLDMYLTAGDADGEEVGYWRKANAIHGWLVENVQDGIDECQPSPVTIDQLRTLKALCERVIETAVMAPGKVRNGKRMTADGWEDIIEDGVTCTNADTVREILPPTQGFFFGSEDIDEWFLDDINMTVEIIEKCEELYEDDSSITFTYRSCW